MISLKKVILENSASDEAKRLGLDYMKFGRWGKDGKVTHKSDNGKLVKVQSPQKHPTNKQSSNSRESLKTVTKFAVDAHGNQKYGDKPYSYHLKKVFDIAVKYKGSSVAKQAALLHDVLEDTPITKETLEGHFGKEVADVVDLLTNQTSKKVTFERIRTNPTAVFVKLCDRLANASEGEKLDKYKKEYPMFRQILKKDGEFNSLWSELDRVHGL